MFSQAPQIDSQYNNSYTKESPWTSLFFVLYIIESLIDLNSCQSSSVVVDSDVDPLDILNPFQVQC
jgi:hypothetical protein